MHGSISWELRKKDILIMSANRWSIFIFFFNHIEILRRFINFWAKKYLNRPVRRKKEAIRVQPDNELTRFTSVLKNSSIVNYWPFSIKSSKTRSNPSSTIPFNNKGTLKNMLNSLILLDLNEHYYLILCIL